MALYQISRHFLSSWFFSLQFLWSPKQKLQVTDTRRIVHFPWHSVVPFSILLPPVILISNVTLGGSILTWEKLFTLFIFELNFILIFGHCGHHPLTFDFKYRAVVLLTNWSCYSSNITLFSQLCILLYPTNIELVGFIFKGPVLICILWGS